MAFPVVHGTNVEDGAFQGYLKTMGIPFVGCDVTASAIGMDKYIMKAVLKECDVPVLDAQLYTLSDYAQIEILLDKVEKGLGYPVIVKPVNLGSSVGISVAKNRVELTHSVDDAFKLCHIRYWWSTPSPIYVRSTARYWEMRMTLLLPSAKNPCTPKIS